MPNEQSQPNGGSFERFADFMSFTIGRPLAFMLALAVALVGLAWAVRQLQ